LWTNFVMSGSTKGYVCENLLPCCIAWTLNECLILTYFDCKKYLTIKNHDILLQSCNSSFRLSSAVPKPSSISNLPPIRQLFFGANARHANYILPSVFKYHFQRHVFHTVSAKITNHPVQRLKLFFTCLVNEMGCLQGI
jgi:hypothetical protein